MRGDAALFPVLIFSEEADLSRLIYYFVIPYFMELNEIRLV